MSGGLRELREQIEALDGVSYYEEDGGLIDMGGLGYFVSREAVLALVDRFDQAYTQEQR